MNIILFRKQLALVTAVKCGHSEHFNTVFNKNSCRKTTSKFTITIFVFFDDVFPNLSCHVVNWLSYVNVCMQCDHLLVLAGNNNA